MSELIAAKRTRASFQGYLTRHINRFQQEKDNMDFFSLQSMLTLVEELEKKFMNAEELVTRLEATDNEVVPDEIPASPSFVKFMNDYDTLRRDLVPLMELKRAKPDNNTSVNNESRSSLFHLPKLEIPVFNGNLTEWTDFKTEFTSFVQDKRLTDVDRFRYLRAALGEGPKRIISSMEMTEENYEQAWKALLERYDNEALIFRSHINAIFSLQGVSGGSADQHRRLLDTVRSHQRALSTLGTDKNLADNLLIAIILQKLDVKTQTEWEKVADKELASWDEFAHFYEDYASTLERVQQAKTFTQKPTTNQISTNQASKPSSSGKKHHTFLLSEDKKLTCMFCKNTNHVIRDCPAFIALDPQSRRSALRGMKVCWKCLSVCKRFKSCPVRCEKCSQGHNTLIHIDQTEPSRNDTGFKTPQSSPQYSPPATSTPLNQQPRTLLVENSSSDTALIGSVMIDVRTASGEYIRAHALLDSGSTINLISEKLARMTETPYTRDRSEIGGIGSLATRTTGCCGVIIKSRFGEHTFRFFASMIPKICDAYPSSPFDITKWNIPSVPLANPNFNKPQRVDLLIGAGLFWELIEQERLSVGPELPICQKTKLGYIIVGGLPMSMSTQKVLTLSKVNEDPDMSLNHLVERFWAIDSFVNEDDRKFSFEEQFCEELFRSTTRRDPTGRYIVKLPFKEDGFLGSSEKIARMRFYNLERKLHKDPQLFQQYSDFIDEYEKLGHLEVVEGFDFKDQHYFIPHHCVLKPTSSTTKLRVVYDASCKTSNGLSLNDILYPGPKIQEDLFITLLKFRLFKFVATVDIVKMYRQTLIDPSQTNFQLIYWRKNVTDPLKILRLRTVTYGTAPGAFLAIRALQQLAIDEENDFPVGSKLLRENFYVDDGLIGCDSVTDLERALKELSGILSRGGMSLGKYCSNSKEILSKIPSELHEKCLRIDEHQIIKTLGLLWEPIDDAFHFCSENIQTDSDTKRRILSQIAKIFDPLGLICPIVTLAKVFYQDLWKLKLDWDDVLPSPLVEKWSQFCRELSELKNLAIPRYVIGGTDSKFMDLHGFSDASEKAYGACVYLVTHHNDSTIKSHLLCAKSRVAPSKTLSIARLELCAAKLLADLMTRVKGTALKDLTLRNQYLWSDSQIVLHWLNSDPSRWSSFVAHRVTKIQDLTSEYDWRHIPGENNPADLVSRGTTPRELFDSSLWWHGPAFLSNPHESWPKSLEIANQENMEEARATKFALFVSPNSDLTGSMHFSTSFRGTRRTFAYVLRFIRNCRLKNRPKSPQSVPKYENIPIPSIKEEIEAEEKFLQHMQQTAFPAEFEALQKGKPLPRNSPIRQLSPFLENGIMRVGGRINKSKLPYDAKHQIVLPKDHPYTNQVFFYFHHFRVFHSGAQATLSAIRSRYWPMKGLTSSRKVCHNCIWCFKIKPRFVTQIMGELPMDRINPQQYRPFNVTGVDFAGPFIVRHHARCRQDKKAYLALFICFATKAVHAELVPDLSSEAFLRALRRFISDRGAVSKIYSDNATNFRGASNYLKEVQRMLQSHETTIRENCNELHIEWTFIPPRMPNYGGLWESSIKLLKRLLIKMTGNLNLTEDELRTFAKQAATVINSRPITVLSNDPNDLEPLTPGHFLYGGPSAALPEAPIDVDDGNLNVVHIARRLVAANRLLWDRFHHEYLALLQPRTKWLVESNLLKPGTVVILKEDNKPPLEWALGKIIDVIPASDGNTRVVKVKTASGEKTRGINRVAALPLHGGDDGRVFYALK